ncbi:hypothetical protein [Salinibacterium sp. ZJ77]|uniref:hypothetical protein n=1 Tax=Salinibacterium sp. ZJ77 TaxID=2708337 RepID=UPI00141E3832|nr:hypothetical protein [Salinibacterium sp. ZJ77]
MNDALGERCDALAGPVVALMQRCIEAQGNPALLPEVIDLLTPIRAVLGRGHGDVHDSRYVAWAQSAPGVLDAIEEAAKQRDANAVWRAFADPVTGFSKLGEACTGYPGW